VFLRSDKKHVVALRTVSRKFMPHSRVFRGKHRASASEAMLFLENMEERLALISINAEEYWKAVMNSAESGIVGGMIYDSCWPTARSRSGRRPSLPGTLTTSGDWGWRWLSA
jgi:hypothetical protein